VWRRRRIPLFRRATIGRMGRRNSPLILRLQEANRLFENGNYPASARIYHELGEEALERQIPQAPHLFILAGTAWMKAGEIDNFMLSFERGLGLLAEREKWVRLRKASENIFENLKKNGFADQAGSMKSWLENKIPAGVKSLPVWIEKIDIKQGKVILPAKCPNCGGPVEIKELEWFDSHANCNYCGSLLTN
jgi:hypothetical protein